MKVTLRINQIDIDVTDSQIQIASGFLDIRELDGQKNEFTKEFSFVGFNEVNVLFGHIYEINNELLSFNPVLKTDACILGDDIQLYDGYIQLLNITKNEANEAPNLVYTVKFYSKFIDFIDKIKEKSIRDLDLSDYNHALSAGKIEDSWNNSYENGFVYPLIDYNEGLGLNKPNKIGIQGNQLTMYPATFARLILTKIAEEAGYELDYTTNFMNSDDLNKLVIPYTWSDKYTINHLLEASVTSTQIINYSFNKYNYVYFDSITKNDYYLYKNDIAFKNSMLIIDANVGTPFPYTLGGAFRAFYGGKHSILLHANIENTGGETNMHLVKCKGTAQTNDPEIIGTILLPANTTINAHFFYITNLEAGDVIAIRARTMTPNVINVLKDTKIDIWYDVEHTNADVREQVELAKTLPDVNQLNFIKALKAQFNLIFTVDRENPKKIIIKSFEEFYGGGKIVDISEKQFIESQKIIANIYDDVYRTYLFDIVNADDSISKEYKNKFGYNYGYFKTDIKNYDFCNEDTYKIKNETFALIHNVNINTGVTSSIYSFILPKIMNDSLDFINTSTTPRFAYYNGLVGGTGWHFDNERLQKTYVSYLGNGVNLYTPYTVTYTYPNYSYSNPTWYYYHPLISTCLYPQDMGNENNFELGFGQEHGHYYNASASTINAYSKYYKNMIEWITNPQTKRVQKSVIMDFVDMYNLDLNDVIYLDDTYYLIEEYLYDISTKECQFKLLTNPFIDVQYGKVKPFFPRPDPGVLINPGLISSKENVQNNIINNSNINVGDNLIIGSFNDGANSANNLIVGYQNFISERNSNNIIIGNNNKIEEDTSGNMIVGSDGVLVPSGTTGAFVFGVNDTGYTATSKSFIVSADTVIFSSQTISFNNTPLSSITSSAVWTTGSTGIYSIKAINNSMIDATADYAVAEGYETLASGYASHAEGYITKANGYASHAEGYDTIASGGSSHAEGHNTTANGNYSHSEGGGTYANGFAAHAEGGDTYANGYYSHSEGYNTNAIGESSHAEGDFTTASGDYSHAEGDYTIASGNCSHAEGESTIANGYASHAEGRNTSAIGYNSHAEGYDTIASGYASHAEGRNTSAIGYNSHAEGGGTYANGYCSHAEGGGTVASGFYSHAEGYGTYVNGFYSHAEGNGVFAIGDSSHAEGYTTVASGESSHAEGVVTTANGFASHAEGSHTTAIGESSHAEGYGTYAVGNYSHAGGYGTKASGTGTAVIAANSLTGTSDYTLYTDNLRVTASISGGTISASTAIYAAGVNVLKTYITLPVGMTDSSFAPTDGATYYFGNIGASTTTATTRRIYVWKSGTIRQATIWAYATTAGTNENISFYIRKNNSADTLIQTEGVAASARNWENTSLAITVSSGDYVEVKMVCPTWATNPVFNSLGGYLLLETFE